MHYTAENCALYLVPCTLLTAVYSVPRLNETVTLRYLVKLEEHKLWGHGRPPAPPLPTILGLGAGGPLGGRHSGRPPSGGTGVQILSIRVQVVR